MRFPTHPKGLTRAAAGLMSLVALVSLAGGCSSQFKGEWVEIRPDGMAPPGQVDTRQLALHFVPPATVRSGIYDAKSRAVDPESVQEAQYVTFNDRQVAQFGVLTARVEDNLLVVHTPDGSVRKLERVKGIFPPMVSLKLTRAAEPAAPAARSLMAADPTPAAVPAALPAGGIAMGQAPPAAP